MVSTDNFSQNGQRFQDSIFTIAEAWQKKDMFLKIYCLFKG